MFDKIKYWYHENQFAITWFIIGWIMMAGLSALAAGNYTTALIDFALAGFNYMLLKR